METPKFKTDFILPINNAAKFSLNITPSSTVAGSAGSSQFSSLPKSSTTKHVRFSFSSPTKDVVAKNKDVNALANNKVKKAH